VRRSPSTSLFELELPHTHGLPFLLLLLFSWALPPVAAFRDASTIQGRLELPQRESKHRLQPSSRTVRARSRKGSADASVIEVPESVGGLEDEGAIDLARPGDVGGLDWWLQPRQDLPLLGEDGEGLATGGAVDGFLAFGCVVEPVRADAFWETTAVTATLFVARLPSSESNRRFVRLGRSTGGAGDLLGINLLEYLTGVLVVRMIHWDRLFVRFSTMRAPNKGVEFGMAGRSAGTTSISRSWSAS